MNRFKPAARTHVRPMGAWWRQNPYFVRYMLREGSAVFITACALVWLVGLLALARGEAAFDAWRMALTTPLSIGFHAVALLFAGYHSLTWFQVMPKTAPRLSIEPRLITAAGLALSVLLSVLILVALRWLVA
jgi:fumarate reductase subunit C